MILEVFKNREQLKLLSEAVFTPQMTMIQESRIIKHWHKMGILPNKATDLNKWTKYTFPEMMWINTVTEMRDFGLPLPQIKMTYDKIIAPNPKNWAALIHSIIYNGTVDVFIIVTKQDSFINIGGDIINVDRSGMVYVPDSQPKISSGLTIYIDDIVEKTLSEKTKNVHPVGAKLYVKFRKTRDVKQLQPA